jgi:ArsR family transcriptional regulator, arsenate/arsenite/antimonite-responsive transcriptional repressor
MREIMNIVRALADENRTRVLLFLQGGEMCVCQIVEMLGLAPSTVSKHLELLYLAGLIDSRKGGRWVFYRLPDKPSARVRDALAWLHQSLADDPQVKEDAKRRGKVLKMDKKRLCCRYKS